VRRSLASAAALFLLACAAGGAAARPLRPASDRIALVAKLEAPVYATAPAGDPARLYVVEQAGKIVVIENGRVRAQPFLDIRARVTSGGEQGLLSVAFDPQYEQNRFFYVDYTDLNGDTRVVRYRSDGTAAIPSSAKLLMYVKDFASNHNGGQLEFGPDGQLYWGNGDGGGGGDPEDNGQNLTRPFAKIERLDVRKPGAKWELVAYGLRNPWRFSFDRAGGDLYIADVGQNAWEEIDFLGRGFRAPVNFGWRRYEGTHLYDPSTPLRSAGRYVQPVHEYPHTEGCSVTGGYVYRGRSVPSAAGRYFFGDYCTGAIWSLRVVDGKATAVRREPFTVPGLSSLGQDSAGELYLMSVSTGALYRLAG
jgi:hypothetical protein